MLTSHISPEQHYIEITVSGKINQSDLEKAVNEIKEPFETWPEIRLMKRIDSFDGIEWQALVEDLIFAFKNLGNMKKIVKVAVVTDKEWVENISKWFSPFFPGEVKVFESEDVEKARTWLV